MTDGRIRLAVVFGGRSSEHGISCLSAASILEQVDRSTYDVVAVGISSEGHWREESDDPDRWRRVGDRLPEVSGDPESPTDLLAGVDVVFPVLHGSYGEDGALQGMMEMLAMPYVGSGVVASAVSMDKVLAKIVLGASRLEVGSFVDVTGEVWGRDRDLVEKRVAQLSWPVFVKPARAGSSFGISKVKRSEDLAEAVSTALRHDSKVIIEKAVEDAREIEVGVLSGGGGPPRVSVPAEIVIAEGHEFYDFDAKYIDGRSELIIPAELAPPVADSVARMAARAFEAVGCSGLARVDFFVSADGHVIVNELNTMPGFTATSGFPRMWQASGIGYGQLIDFLIEQALATGARRGK